MSEYGFGWKWECRTAQWCTLGKMFYLIILQGSYPYYRFYSQFSFLSRTGFGIVVWISKSPANSQCKGITHKMLFIYIAPWGIFWTTLLASTKNKKKGKTVNQKRTSTVQCWNASISLIPQLDHHLFTHNWILRALAAFGCSSWQPGSWRGYSWTWDVVIHERWSFGSYNFG